MLSFQTLTLQQWTAWEMNAKIKAQNNIQVHTQNKSMNLKGAYYWTFKNTEWLQ